MDKGLHNKEKTDRFLRQNGLHHEVFDLEVESEKFCNEIDASLVGKESSLAGIPTFVSADGEIMTGKKVIVIDAGGTNFRVATVIFDDEKRPTVDYFKKYRMPGSDGVISYDEFNKTVVDYLEPVLKESDLVGFCFSYQCEINSDRDGVIGVMSKEVNIEGAVGNLVCANINKELTARGHKPKTFCLINDTVASMLGGVASTLHKQYDGFVGFILGTGINCCYSEPTSSITKSLEAMSVPGNMIINLESGKYAGMPRAELDDQLDAKTSHPGAYLFEKMASGAYQGDLFLSILKLAAKEGLFSERFVSSIEVLSGLTAMEIDLFCFEPHKVGTLHGLCDGADDIETVLLLANSFYERIAKLATLQFAGLVKRTGCGCYKSRPFCIVAEGTTFYKSKFFRPLMDYYVKQYIEKQLGRYIEFIAVENATLIGTAAAVLLNQ